MIHRSAAYSVISSAGGLHKCTGHGRDPEVNLLCKTVRPRRPMTMKLLTLVDRVLAGECAVYMKGPTAEQIAQDVEEAALRLKHVREGVLHTTPLLRSQWLEGAHGGGPRRAYVKLESEQVTGSFKARGGLNAVAKARSEGAEDVTLVTASTGNHGLGVANALAALGGRGIVFVPADARPTKIAALAAFSAAVEVRRVPGECLAAEKAARAFAAADDLVQFVSPYNDPPVVAGHGTVAVEIDRVLAASDADLNAPHCVYVTVGGGGLIAGVASYLKQRSKANWRVVGALPSQSPVMARCVEAGRILPDVPCGETLSDGSAGLIEQGTVTLKPCMDSVDDWILVEEVEIASAVREFFLNHLKVVEGTAGVALAAFLKDRAWHAEHPDAISVVLACGGNIDPETFIGIVRGKQ